MVLTILMTALWSPMGQVSDYHGFRRNDFPAAGTTAVVVEPKTVAQGRPWVWRTEFFDHRPQVDLALLERGYHLVYLNLGNTFGAPAPMWRFSQLYQELTAGKWALNRRVVLEGFSRGGLYAYNWAVRNPNKVMAIYGDAPVCDFKTWPYGGMGGKRSESDWNELIKAYGFPNEKAALEYPFNPVDSLAVLAKARVPIIHVVGDADEVVPVEANTGLIESRYKALKGTIKVIHKPGGLHHPHSLDDPKPVVDFLTKHANDTARTPSSTMLATPNLESRYNSAGWNGRSWLDQHLDGVNAVELDKPDTILIGDSITQGFGGLRRQTGEPGGAARKAWLGKISNQGISGDRVQNVLWRLENAAIDGNQAKHILIMIGINNYPDDSPAEIAIGIERVYLEAMRRRNKANVMIQPIMPAGTSPTQPIRIWCNEVNAKLTELHNKKKIKLAFPNHDYLLNADGTHKANLVSSDGIHIKAEGYERWGMQLSEVTAKQ